MLPTYRNNIKKSQTHKVIITELVVRQGYMSEYSTTIEMREVQSVTIKEVATNKTTLLTKSAMTAQGGGAVINQTNTRRETVTADEGEAI